MTPQEPICKEGLVTNLAAGKAVVQMIAPESCHSCRIKAFCGVTDEERGRYEVPQGTLEIGDRVRLEILPGTGFKALYMAYLAPFVLMLAIVMIGTYLQAPEHWVGLLALAVLPVYYLALSLFKRQLNHQLRFKISKL